MRSRKVFCVTSYIKAEMQIGYVSIFTLYKCKTQPHGNTVTEPEMCFKPVIKISTVFLFCSYVLTIKEKM